MAGGNFSLKFMIVSEKEKINKIAEAAEQDFIAQAQYVLIVYSIPSRTENSFGEMGKIYLRQQAGAAIQNFLLKIEEKNLDTCWIGHFNEEKLKKALSIPSSISANIEAVFPIGYESKTGKSSRKIDLDQVLYFEKHNNKKMKKTRKIEV